MKNIFILFISGISSMAMADAVKQFVQDQKALINNAVSQAQTAGKGIAQNALTEANATAKNVINEAQQAASNFAAEEGQELKNIEKYRLSEAEKNQMNVVNAAIQAAQAGGIQQGKQVFVAGEKAAIGNEIDTQKIIATGAAQQARTAAGELISSLTPEVQADAQAIAQNAAAQVKEAGQQIGQSFIASEKQLINADGPAVAKEAMEKAKEIAGRIIPHH